MKFLFSVFACIVGLAGCSPLTKTQVKAVNTFALASQDFSAYPSRVMSGLADVRLARFVLYANTVDSARIHLKELDSAFTFRMHDSSVAEKYNITFRIIDKYAQSLVLLTSDKYSGNLRDQAQRFGTDLDALTSTYNARNLGPKLPSSIGAAVGQLIAFGGTQYIRRKQAREVKKFVPQADELVQKMTDNLLEFLESLNVADLIKHEEESLKGDYLQFLRKSVTYTMAAGKRDTLMMMSNTRSTLAEDLEYIRLKFAMENVKILRKETAEATRKLRKAHGKLLEAIKEKRKLKTSIAEVQELYDGVRQIRKTIGKIEKYKNTLDGPEE